MKFLRAIFTMHDKTAIFFGEQKGKTLAEYQRELLIKMGKKQFEKLNKLGLGIQLNAG